MGLYNAPRDAQLEILGLLRDLFGSPTSDAALAFLLGFAKAPRTRPLGAQGPDAVSPPPATLSVSTGDATGKTFVRPPWLIAKSQEAANRNDLFRVE